MKYSKRDVLKALDLKTQSTVGRLAARLGITYNSGFTEEDMQAFLECKRNHPNIRAFLYQNTCFERYGTLNVSGSASVKEKKKQTYLKHYGVEHFAMTEEWREKTKATNNKKFGVDFVGHSPAFQQRQSNTFKEKREVFEKLHPELTPLSSIPAMFDREDITTVWLLEKKLNLHFVEGYNHTQYVTLEDMKKINQYFEDLGTKPSTSTGERQIEDFIKTIYDGPVHLNVRDIIAPLELDIYLPERRVAIEFNGLYFHRNRDISYHKNKTDLCEKLGIRLIQFWDFEWYNQQDICKSIIEYAIGMCSKSFYARKLQLREIKTVEWRDFLNNNHIQGYAPATYRLGLYDGDQLIQGIGVTHRSHKRGEVELNRMVTLKNHHVCGGFERLVKEACSRYNLEEIVSYVDRRLFQGNGYNKAGFEKLYEIRPAYYYFNISNYQKTGLQPRFHFMKSMIEKKYNNGELSFFDDKLTEWENMQNNNYYRVYDCGRIKVIYRRKDSTC